MAVLDALAQRGVARLRDVAADTGVPAPTVVRILETLVHCGYVRKLPSRAGYCLTAEVMRLAGGYQGLPRVLDPVCRAADALTRAHRWPASVCTLDGDAMVVRYSTLPDSPFGHKPTTIARRLSLTERAHGRAWLAWSEPEERIRLVGEDPALERDLAQVRACGYARRLSGVEADTMTFAVPVWADRRMVATLGMTHFTRGLRDPALLVAALTAAGAALRRELDGTNKQETKG